jgi:hypothetical protein
MQKYNYLLEIQISTKIILDRIDFCSVVTQK